MSRLSFGTLVAARNVRRIEIPMIQRDYAQGRAGARQIRDAFLDVLCTAALGAKSVHLDFVYGEISGDKLVPLDGQQRLTALFLLHWYVAAGAGVAPDEAARHLPALTYETRHSSRVFCERLALERPILPLEASLPTVSRWLFDRSWVVRAWKHDPTIASMLVVLDGIQERLKGADYAEVWQRLLDDVESPITFDFLHLDKLGLTEELYVKMNSRGMPLTEFENFKAGLEGVVQAISDDLHRQLSSKIDGDWCDLFWRLRGRDNAIDSQFLSYFLFATDSVAISTQRPVRTLDAPLDRARTVFELQHDDAAANVQALMAAFDVWVARDVPEFFRGVFTNTRHEPGKVAIFDDVQLFDACCRQYASRSFQGPKLLLFHCVVQHLVTQSPNFRARIRNMRNLVQNSGNELRGAVLPELFRAATEVMANGVTAEVAGFNRRQTQEERAKAMLISENVDVGDALRRLEDHPLLRGCLASFDLNDPKFPVRARAFERLFPPSSAAPARRTMAALLAKGNYARSMKVPGRFQFGTSTGSVWRELLTGANVSRMREVLPQLLDEFAEADETTAATDTVLDEVIALYLAEQERKQEFEWRYYFVKYDATRRGESGIYASDRASFGFNLCMLQKSRLTGWYRDPYLTAVYEAAGQPKGAKDPWFLHGYPHHPRWLDIPLTGAGMRCVDDGFVLRPPSREVDRAGFLATLQRFDGDDSGLVRVPQTTRPAGRVDTADRVLVGAAILQSLATPRAEGN